MATLLSRSLENGSLRSSVTESDLEEARQKLLEHVEEEELGENTKYDDERSAGEVSPMYPPTYPPTYPQIQPAPVTTLRRTVPVEARQWPTYGSVTTMSVTSQPNRPKPAPTKRYRLPLIILLAFDWGLVVFFSVVVMKDVTFKTYFQVHISDNYFDLVIIATYRFVVNFLFYIVLGWVTRIVMALMTVGSALYIPVKAYYAWSSVGQSVTVQSIAILMMLLMAFGMPWVTAFFFEFKFLPAEKSRLDIPSWWNIKAWVWPRAYLKSNNAEDTPSLHDLATEQPVVQARHPRPRAGLSASTVSLDFRTPVGSSRASPIPYDRHGDEGLHPIREDQEFTSSAEHQSPECDQTMSSEDLRFKRESLNALDSFKTMTDSNQGWAVEKQDGELVIYSQVIDGKKVFKAEGVMGTSAEHLFGILYPGECTPQWNPQCQLTETVYRVDDATDLVYTVSNSMGPVSSRDFVSIRYMEKTGGRYYAISKAIVTAMKPEQPGKVRAENGPCGYLVIPVSDSQCKLIWILNSNLKGWLLQSVIDQTLTTVLVSSFSKLKTYCTSTQETSHH